MDLNDISLRIKLIYQAIGESIKTDLREGLTLTVTQDDYKYLMWSAAQREDAELKILTIIDHIGALKDPLRNKFGKNQAENIINNCFELQLITDICNSYKHSYPANSNRSGKYPKFKNVKTKLRLLPGSSIETSHELKIIPNENLPGGYEKKYILSYPKINKGQLILDADIVDVNDDFIMSFQDMITEGIKQWERFIQANES